LLTSLYTYLKVDQTPTIQVNAFSTAYLPSEKRDDYRSFMQGKHFPLTAVQKDTTEIKGKLRQRRVEFSGGIRLAAPPESFREYITMETVPADGVTDGQPSEWDKNYNQRSHPCTRMTEEEFLELGIGNVRSSRRGVNSWRKKCWSKSARW
jgi:hypothetical protein